MHVSTNTNAMYTHKKAKFIVNKLKVIVVITLLPESGYVYHVDVVYCAIGSANGVQYTDAFMLIQWTKSTKQISTHGGIHRFDSKHSVLLCITRHHHHRCRLHLMGVQRKRIVSTRVSRIQRSIEMMRWRNRRKSDENEESNANRQ